MLTPRSYMQREGKLHNKIRKWGHLRMQNHTLDHINPILYILMKLFGSAWFAPGLAAKLSATVSSKCISKSN